MKGFQDLKFNTEIVLKNGQIILGKRTTAYDRVTLGACGGVLKIGDHVVFNRNCIVLSHERIDIGEGCMFGPNVIIYDHDHVFDEQGIRSGEYKTSSIVIEEGCWIGANAIILRGTHIGKGCVIGAGTMVQGEIPSHSLVTNNRELKIMSIEKREK